ncbi:hypothetical protein C7N43_32245 [Sphingobacteriales bacterium UPWRP_1]|nr:hypothetical protein B6N25_17455 [Sphingobacteriales bacterium TSM_CSS]PSJ72821.1 hypothetical protein C7N43_32245 [Sphingobacteriales bacterium UPWRP_1]
MHKRFSFGVGWLNKKANLAFFTLFTVHKAQICTKTTQNLMSIRPWRPIYVPDLPINACFFRTFTQRFKHLYRCGFG